MEEKAEWIDSNVFEHNHEEHAAFNWGEDNKDEESRLVVDNGLKETKFYQGIGFK